MKIQFKSSEVFILLAASLMSFLANLPETMLGGLVDRKVLIGSLTALIVVAMFRYLQMFLLLTISILAIGANLPSALASELGISQLALLISLGILVALALLNRVLKVLPTGVETPEEMLANAQRALLTAIAKGDEANVQRMVDMGLEVNFTLDGMNPLRLAAQSGHADIVQLLISRGAVFNVKNPYD